MLLSRHPITIRSPIISGDENISPDNLVVARISPVVMSMMNTFPFTVQQQQIANFPGCKLRFPINGQQPMAESSFTFQLKHISLVTLYKLQSWSPNRKRYWEKSSHVSLNSSTPLECFTLIVFMLSSHKDMSLFWIVYSLYGQTDSKMAFLLNSLPTCIKYECYNKQWCS